LGTLIEDITTFFNRRLRDEPHENPCQNKAGDKPSNMRKERNTTRRACLHAEGYRTIEKLQDKPQAQHGPSWPFRGSGIQS
jgi:hypothetical protein